MTSRPAIPTLLLIPDDSQVDFRALYAIATAYAHSGLLISDHGQTNDRVEFSFPAVVCSSFAIELFLKFFLMLERPDRNDLVLKQKSGHRLAELWKKILPVHQALIAGMFQNRTGVPLLNASDVRLKLYEDALINVGEAPFIKWRYAHELVGPTVMSHAAITEVLDALGCAANYVMKKKSELHQPGA